MRKINHKTKTSTILLILLLTISAMLVISPSVIAQQIQTKKTYSYIGAVPNPVGVNQEVLLHIGMTDALSSVEMGWEGLTVTVEDPEGIVTTLGPYRTDATGGTGDIFIPTKIGTYTLTTHFPEQTNVVTPFFIGEPYECTFQASVSDPLEIEVMQDQVQYYPGHSLPSDYWTRPIDGQLREWKEISGSWLVPSSLMGVSVYPAWIAPYNDGPETAHILWTNPMTSGGLAGGETGEHGFESGDAYEGKWGGSIIVSGRLYYKLGGSRGLTPVEYHCVDLHTGEELWSKVFLDNASISFGQLLYWDGFNNHGVFDYLYVSSGGNWYVYDAYSGDWRFTIENIPSGTTLRGPNGELYIVQVNQAQGWMGLWNATDLCLSQAVGSNRGSWGNSVHMKTFDAATTPSAWTVNVTIPTNLPGSVRTAFFEDKVIGSQNSLTEVTLWGLSLEPGKEGDLLFNETWNADAEWVSGNVTMMGMSGGWVALAPDVGVIGVKETVSFYGFSFETGEYLWGPTESQYYLDQFFGDGRFIAYGRFYSTGVSGIVYCYNATTGELLWSYPADDKYSEILWANNWWTEPMFVTDGKLYIGHAEHSPIDPKPRGAPFLCLDAYTGDVIWRADGLLRQTHWGGLAIIGDSIITGMDTYDQRLYGLGKGPSDVTVEKISTAVTKGTAVTIQGTVMDISPGTEDASLKLRFPKGVPAVSDASMSDWMLYVYKQFECPEDVTGVDVALEIITPSGNYQQLDRTTSDVYGNWAFGWCPEETGTYMIIATFEGSNAYYASTETTYLTVSAPMATSEVDLSSLEEGQSNLEDSISNQMTYILAILVIVIVALLVAIYSLLKKQK